MPGAPNVDGACPGSPGCVNMPEGQPPCIAGVGWPGNVPLGMPVCGNDGCGAEPTIGIDQLGAADIGPAGGPEGGCGAPAIGQAGGCDGAGVGQATPDGGEAGIGQGAPDGDGKAAEGCAPGAPVDGIWPGPGNVPDAGGAAKGAEPGGGLLQLSSGRMRMRVSAESNCSAIPGKYSEAPPEGGAVVPGCCVLTGVPHRGQAVAPGGSSVPHCPQWVSNMLDITGSAFLQPES